jgi:hypothetical protein
MEKALKLKDFGRMKNLKRRLLKEKKKQLLQIRF